MNLISIRVFYTPSSNARIRKFFHISQSHRLAGEIGLCERTSYSGSRRELFIVSRGCLTILHHTCTRSRSRSREPPTCTAFRSHIMDLKSQGWYWTTCRSRDFASPSLSWIKGSNCAQGTWRRRRKWGMRCEGCCARAASGQR